jgi:hypothetical protein
MDNVHLKREIEAVADSVNSLIHWGFLKHGADWIKAWHQHDLKWSDGGSGYLTMPRDRLESFARAARDTPEVFAGACAPDQHKVR